MLLILLTAVWALLGTSLPLTPTAVDIETLESPLDLPSNVTHTPGFLGHNATVSPRAKIGKRVVNEWPWDLPGNDDEREKSNPARYNCNAFAGQHNKIPPRLMMPATPGGVRNIYLDEEIYRAFRDGALLLLDILTNPLDVQHLQISHNGVPYPRPYDVMFATSDQSRVRIGIGNWRTPGDQQNLPVPQRTTVIYEWPLINGGHYPHPNLNNNMWNTNPGFDRVLFQIIHGLPVYIGAVQLGIAQGQPDRAHPPRDSWGYVFNDANGRLDQRAIDSMSYPGLDGNARNQGDGKMMRNKRNATPASPVAVLPDYQQSAMPTPSQGPGGGGGSGAPGGGSGIGPFPYYGLGGIGQSGGGAAGPQGSWDLYGGPLAYNEYKRGGPGLLLSGPSHLQF